MKLMIELLLSNLAGLMKSRYNRRARVGGRHHEARRLTRAENDKAQGGLIKRTFTFCISLVPFGWVPWREREKSFVAFGV